MKLTNYITFKKTVAIDTQNNTSTEWKSWSKLFYTISLFQSVYTYLVCTCLEDYLCYDGFCSNEKTGGKFIPRQNVPGGSDYVPLLGLMTLIPKKLNTIF